MFLNQNVWDSLLSAMFSCFKKANIQRTHLSVYVIVLYTFASVDLNYNTQNEFLSPFRQPLLSPNVQFNSSLYSDGFVHFHSHKFVFLCVILVSLVN